MSKIKIGIIGGAGYAAGELLRILRAHPHVELSFIQSKSHGGKPVASVHRDLLPFDNLRFSVKADHSADCVFLCQGHGRSRAILASEHELASRCRIIDLSQDHRLRHPEHDFVYGLPEANRTLLRDCRHVANPGCFATGILLALLPLAAARRLGEIHVTSVTGSTGAGQALTETTHFSWRSHNLSVYKAFEHQHLAEIRETLSSLHADWRAPLNLIPMRGPFTRGILTSAYLDFQGSEEDARELYRDYYQDHPFTHVTGYDPDLKCVVNTNHCMLAVAKHGTKLHVVSVIDNLLKGASGQAVQNMNLMFGFPEETGLNLKASVF